MKPKLMLSTVLVVAALAIVHAAAADTDPAAAGSRAEQQNMLKLLDQLDGFDEMDRSDFEAAVERTYQCSDKEDFECAGLQLKRARALVDDDDSRQILIQASQYRDKRHQFAEACACSLHGGGCYSLPSRDLLQMADQVEGERYRICTSWNQNRSSRFANVQEAEAHARGLSVMLAKVRGEDQRVDNAVASWKRERQRQLAEQEQQQEQQRKRTDNAWLAGMATAIVGGVAQSKGLISQDQGVGAAVSVAKSVQNGGGALDATGSALQSLQSSVPASAKVASAGGRSSSSASSDDDRGSFQFSCYSPGMRICINYTVYSRQKFNQMKNQCGRSEQIMPSGCDRDGPRCTISNASGIETTFDPTTSDPEGFRQKCEASGGRFSS